MEDIRSIVEASLRESGANLVGFANLHEVLEDTREGFSHAVFIAVALDPAIIAEIETGPTMRYYEEYRRANALLSGLARQAAELLRERGFSVLPNESTSERFDRVTLRALLPHKTVATRAGMGWIGKNDLLITPEYGSAVQFTSMLTDAYLGSSEPVNRSRCGTCTACVDACPVGAPSGEHWDVSKDRDSFFDVH
jgi:epoxyqueuosine reductase